MELKEKIIKYIFENKDEFQIINATVNAFRDYIYDSKGEYLIGGELIASFISKAVDLIINNK